MPKPKVLHEWRMPRRLRRDEFKQSIVLARHIIPRILLLTGLLVVPFVWYVASIAPRDILPMDKLVPGLCGLGMLVAVFLFVPGMDYLLGGWYKIDERMVIRTASLGTNTMHWQSVTGYHLEQDINDIFGATAIVLHTKSGRTFTLWLDDADLTAQVMETVKSRCPLMDTTATIPGASRVMVSGNERSQLLLVTIVYSLGHAFVLHLCMGRQSWINVYLMLVPLIAGPGTLGCLLLYGIRRFKEKIVTVHAIAFNMLGFVLGMVALFLIGFHYCLDLIQQTSGGAP